MAGSRAFAGWQAQNGQLVRGGGVSLQLEGRGLPGARPRHRAMDSPKPLLCCPTGFIALGHCSFTRV
eukprot:1106008-Pyramimonas_sp.AAC.1